MIIQASMEENHYLIPAWYNLNCFLLNLILCPYNLTFYPSLSYTEECKILFSIQ